MLTERLKEMRDFSQQRQYKQYRTDINYDCLRTLKKLKYDMTQRSAYILKFMCDAEDPIVFKDEKISFIRTKNNIPAYYNKKILKKYYNYKKGIVFEPFHNICPDYSILLTKGLENIRKEAELELPNKKNKKEKIFLNSVLTTIDSVLSLAKRYELSAKAIGNETIAELFSRVPRYPAQTFHEALQSIRFISSMFNMADNYQLGFGRMDQYLWPLYEKDINSGRLTRENAKELCEEFFISLNKDTDLYRGVQQGDNGQSVMLGGCKPEDGSSAINDLTYLILEVSRDLKLIDPKINLRIDSNTPEDLLELGCELTKCGLGFPQYSNDEVVIPALVNAGYSIEDARNYTVAACWEFIIPGKGLDVVNQGAVSFPYAVDWAFEQSMKSLFGFNEKTFCKLIYESIRKQTEKILKKRDIKTLPSPFASIFFEGTIENHKDASECAKYQNIGIHGAGSSNAADAIIAIKTIFHETGHKGLKELLSAKKANFRGYDELFKKVHDDMPKVGNDDDKVDAELKFLFDCFADVCKKISIKKKKVIRAGSGSAMFYIWLTDKKTKWSFEPKVKTTADGKLDGEPLSTSLAPSHGIKVEGVLSVLKSYSKIDYSKIVNGGPITIELSPTIFNSNEGIKKLAQLLRYFVRLGNQQLQLNVLDASILEDAIAHPENHRNLIVRVWGWSGYFTELAPEYQIHVLSRHKYGV